MIVTDSVLQIHLHQLAFFQQSALHKRSKKKIIMNRGKHELKEFVYLHHRSYSERASEGELAEDTCISYTLRRISSTRYLRNVIYLAVKYRVGGPVVKMRYERLELPAPVSALKHRWNNRNNNADELNIIIIGLGDEDVDIASGLRVPYNRPKRSSFNLKDCIF